ncbi:MAG: phosphoribosyltransferase family protein [Bacteroidota bacterium]|nr:phosphoribosyltransferase family protein [Bacteroidota bacterium]
MLIQEKHICLSCYYKLPRTKFKINTDNPTEKIFKGRIPILGASSFLYFKQKGLTQKLIHQFKYRNNKEVGHYLGELFGKEIAENNPEYKPDIITSVPLHYRKQNLRGYNQSEEISNKISETLNIPVNNKLITRKLFTDTQTHKKRYERWKNTGNIFEINTSDNLNGKHIAIVDDVITTGATIESCAQILLNNFECKISFLSLCIATH